MVSEASPQALRSENHPHNRAFLTWQYKIHWAGASLRLSSHLLGKARSA
jgi:hypothetical protein